MAYEEIIEDYLGLCRDACNRGGYARLSGSWGSIDDSVFCKFSNNGYRHEEVLKVVGICQAVLDDRIKAGRHFSWPSYLEKEIRKGISTALRGA